MIDDLEMIHIKAHLNSIQCIWLKKRKQGKLMEIYFKALHKYGSKLIFESNLSNHDIKRKTNSSVKYYVVKW